MTHGARARGGEAAFLLSAALLCSAPFLLPTLPGWWVRPDVMATALTLDLALGLPALGWLFVVRKRRGAAWILGPLFLTGLALARASVPGAARLPVGEILLFAVEGGVLLYLLFRIRVARSAFRIARGRGLSRSEALRVALVEVLGSRAGEAVFGEVAVLAYAVAGWRTPTPPTGDAPTFTLHRRNGYPAVLGALLMAVAAETAILHLLLHSWSPLAAWIATGLSLYSAVWLVGDFHAARHTPSVVAPEALRLRVGLRWRVDVPWSAVAGLSRGPRPEGGLALTLLGDPDLWLRLREPLSVQGPFGLRLERAVLGVAADEPEVLEALLRERLPDGDADPEEEPPLDRAPARS